MPNRDLKVSIDGDGAGLDAALAKSTAEARALDRELAKLERQQAAEEKVAAASALAVREFGKAEDKAALSARKMGNEVARAAEQAERAQVRALAAAEAAAKGSFDKARADKLAANADQAVERAAIKAAEAQLAAAAAAARQAEEEKKVARAAELAAAAQRLGALKASGAVKQHNKLLGELQGRFGDLSKEGAGAFKAIETTGTKAAASIGSTGPGAIALVAAALGSVPFVATLAEGAITLGVGGALAGLGLAATKGDAQVQAALGRMTSHIKSEAKGIAAPFKATWLEIAQTGEETFDALAPHLKQDFATLAPAVSRLVQSAGYAITQLGPAFDAASKGAAALMDELGPKLPEITRNLGHSIEVMGDASAKAAPQFANIVAALANGSAEALVFSAHMLDLAVKVGPAVNLAFGAISQGAASVDALHAGLSTLTFGLVKTDHSLKTGGGSFQTFAQQSTVAAAKAGQLMTAEQAAALGADQLKAALDALTGKTLTEREALVGYRQSITAMTQALKDNGHAHGFDSEKGAANEAALDKVASSAQAAAEAMKSAGKDPAPFLEQARQRIVAMAEKMHYSASAAEDLANKLLGIKPPPPIKLSMDDADFMTKLHRAQGLKLDPKTGLLMGDNSSYLNKWLQAKGLKIDTKTGKFVGNNADYYNKWLAANHLKINTKTGKITGNTSPFWAAVRAIPSTVKTVRVGVYYVPLNSYNEPGKTHKATGGPIHRAGGGPIQHLAGGGPSGLISGPGTGISDSILVAASNNEYMVNAQAARVYRPLLDLINYGRGRSPASPAALLSGGSGGSTRPAQVSQTNIFQGPDPHVVARESARELAWVMRG